jgi:ComF family protein
VSDTDTTDTKSANRPGLIATWFDPLRRILASLAASVFPDLCPLCQAPLPHSGSSFCAQCEASLVPISHPFCPRCGKPFASKLGGDHPCGDCYKHPRPPFSRARAFGLYQGPLAEGIRRLKYRAELSLGRVLSALLEEAFEREFSAGAYDLVIPVPLHRRRLRSRGFNQAILLSRGLARRHGLRLDCRNLQRIRDTDPQYGLSIRQREENVKRAFALKRPELVAGRRVLLVDDVYTTGATAKECARVLKRAKAAGIDVLTLARAGAGSPPPPPAKDAEITADEIKAGIDL